MAFKIGCERSAFHEYVKSRQAQARFTIFQEYTLLGIDSSFEWTPASPGPQAVVRRLLTSTMQARRINTVKAFIIFLKLQGFQSLAM